MMSCDGELWYGVAACAGAPIDFEQQPLSKGRAHGGEEGRGSEGWREGGPRGRAGLTEAPDEDGCDGLDGAPLDAVWEGLTVRCTAGHIGRARKNEMNAPLRSARSQGLGKRAQGVALEGLSMANMICITLWE